MRFRSKSRMALMTRSFFAIAIFCWLVVPGSSKTSELPPSDQDNGGLFLPGGFEALVVVDSLGRARHFVVNDNGDIYVQARPPRDPRSRYRPRDRNAVRPPRKGTVGLRDLDGDGKADSIAHFGDYAGRGRGGTGITIHNGYLYESSRKIVYRTKLKPGELVPTGEPEVVFSDMESGLRRNWHTTKPLAFDNKGNIYIPFGGKSDACQDKQLYGPVGIPNGKGLDPCPELETLAGVWRFDANKLGLTQKDGERFATGIRSIVGMEWNPNDESLYAIGNGMDNFHTVFPDHYSYWQAAMLPAETLMKITEGSDYGWPYAYYDHLQKKNVLQPGYGGDGKMPARSKVDDPVIAFDGHWAPMEVMIYHGDQFPERYNNGAFIAFHGSTDRPPYPQSGYIVCFAPFDADGKSTGEWEVFADGFTQVDTVVNTSDAVYRPMALDTGPDGSLYIGDSNKGKIWRVMYKGDKDKFGQAGLAAMEKRKSRSYIRAPIEGQDLRPEGDSYSGRIHYRNTCISCHQRDGRGDSNRYPPLDSDWITGDGERLIDVVLNGLQGEIEIEGKLYNEVMPANRYLDDHTVASLVSYVRRRFADIEVPVNVGQVSKIRSETANMNPRQLDRWRRLQAAQ